MTEGKGPADGGTLTLLFPEEEARPFPPSINTQNNSKIICVYWGARFPRSYLMFISCGAGPAAAYLMGAELLSQAPTKGLDCRWPHVGKEMNTRGRKSTPDDRSG